MTGSVGAVGRLLRVRGVTWRWRDDAPEEAKLAPGRGVLAQDVEAVFPELVETDRQGIKRVYYAGLVPPLCAAVAELLERWRALATRPGAHRHSAARQMTEPAAPVAEQIAAAAAGARRTALDVDALARVFPELVATNERGTTTIAYHGLIGPLIEAIRELDGRVLVLEAGEGR